MECLFFYIPFIHCDSVPSSFIVMLFGCVQIKIFHCNIANRLLILSESYFSRTCTNDTNVFSNECLRPVVITWCIFDAVFTFKGPRLLLC